MKVMPVYRPLLLRSLDIISGILLRIINDIECTPRQVVAAVARRGGPAHSNGSMAAEAERSADGNGHDEEARGELAQVGSVGVSVGRE